MMSKELAAHQAPEPPMGMADLETLMRFAELISESSLVPATYRGKTGNILVAWGLGQAMGLSQMEALYRIDVIQGKPCASGELIASNVRKAGHKLRTVVNEAEQWAETTITRRDDPESPITVRRDMHWAKRMGLSQKENYIRQGPTMLSYRSITAAARLACPEALYGVQYTADELQDGVGGTGDAPVVPGEERRGSLAAFTAPAVAEPDAPDATPEPTVASVTEQQMRELSDLFEQAGFATDPASPVFREQRAEYMSVTLGRDVTSTRDMTADDAARVIEALGDFITSGAVDAEIVAPAWPPAGEPRTVQGEGAVP